MLRFEIPICFAMLAADELGFRESNERIFFCVSFNSFSPKFEAITDVALPTFEVITDVALPTFEVITDVALPTFEVITDAVLPTFEGYCRFFTDAVSPMLFHRC